MQCLLQRDHDVRLDVTSSLRRRLPSAESAKRRPSATTAEKGFKKITKTGAAEFKFDSAILTAPLTKSATARLLRPIAAVVEIRRVGSNPRRAGRTSGVSPDRSILRRLR